MNKNIRRIIGLVKRKFTYSDKPTSDNRILLIPPTRLNGSFGDELMVVTFLEHYKEYEVDLYESFVNRRPDLFKGYRVNYIQWTRPVDWTKYIGVYILGADNMTGAYGTASPLFKLTFLKAANKYGLPSGILGFSVNEKMNADVKSAMQDLLPHTRFFLREGVSYERAKDFLPEENIHLVADLAFLCPSAPCQDTSYLNWVNRQNSSGRTIFAVCPNAIQAEKVGLQVYLQGIVALIKGASQKSDLSCALLYHDLRFHCEGKYSDRHLAQMLYNELYGTIPCYTTSKIRNGVILKSYLNHVEFTFTGRMHFGISGYSLKKPMFGIAYEGKFSGLQKLFGLDPDQSLMNKLDSLADYQERFNNFILNLEENKEKVKNNYDAVISLSRRNFE